MVAPSWKFFYSMPKKGAYEVEARYGDEAPLFWETKKKPYKDDALIRKIARQTEQAEKDLKHTFSKSKRTIDFLKPPSQSKQEEGTPSPEAQKLAQDANFFASVVCETDKKIKGELEARHTITLCGAGRLVENANLTSFNLLVNSSNPGAGKDYVVKNTLALLPKPQLVYRSRISEKLFTYWHNKRNEPEWTWDGKVFYGEDISNNVLNSDVFKVMSSSGSHATIVINQEPVDIEIVGKPVMVITSATANPSKEIMRRYPILNLDEGIKQTESIMGSQAEAAEVGERSEYNPMITEALATLKRVKVRVPYASKLVKLFPKEHVIMRTHFDRFLDYIKASAAFHQHQREVDGKGFVIATGLDYDIARVAIVKTASNKHMIPLTKNLQRLLDIVKEFDIAASAADVENKVTFMSRKSIYTNLDKLADNDLLEKTSEYNEKAKKDVAVWRYKAELEIKLPSWCELESYQNTTQPTHTTKPTQATQATQLSPVNKGREGREGFVACNSGNKKKNHAVVPDEEVFP